MPTTAELAYFAGDSYNDGNSDWLDTSSVSDPPSVAAPIALPGWIVIDQSQGSLTGFAATAYENESTHQVVIAFRGTDPNSVPRLLSDFIADGLLALGIALQGNPLVGFVKEV